MFVREQRNIKTTQNLKQETGETVETTGEIVEILGKTCGKTIQETANNG